MVSLATRPFPPIRWLPALKFPDNLITLYHQFSRFFWSESDFSTISLVLNSASRCIAIILASWIFLYSGIKKKRNKFVVPVAEFNGETPEAMALGPGDDDDETQFKDFLVASIFNPSLSHPTEPNPDQEPKNPPKKTTCSICLEDKDSWQMFEHETCPHTFCYVCMSRYITTKIHEQAQRIRCVAPNCKALLTYDACRFMIPDKTLAQWDLLLCTSVIPEPHKLYCPFGDCSALLVNDSMEVMGKIRCLVCGRTFCGECRVPWHTDFTCVEFRNLRSGKGGNGDVILKALAEKKKWKRCPKCRMYVERSQGCMHMTCRCSYEFCYMCGRGWSDAHRKCETRRGRWITRRGLVWINQFL